jgi:hypothetical protein
LTSIRILLQECGWETLDERRNKHNKQILYYPQTLHSVQRVNILLFHKMVNGLL